MFEDNDIFIHFTREEWSKLRDHMPMTISEEDIAFLKGLNEPISLQEIEAVYLPISRLLNLHINARKGLYAARDTFLGTKSEKVPYVIGIAGSVAAGKSTTARVLKTLLERSHEMPRVDIVTTDNFLYPNAVLESRNIMDKKGFPESYDIRMLIKFLIGVKSGIKLLRIPVYSHVEYDIVKGQYQEIRDPDVIILEGLNVLQVRKDGTTKSMYVSDFLDFSIYVDASIESLEKWFIERFLILKRTSFINEKSYFNKYASLGDEEAVKIASGIWKQINEVNLKENIISTRGRAQIILEKDQDHSIKNIWMRKL